MLHVIWTEHSLHQPMFCLLALLTLADLCLGLSTVHTVLGILWGLSQEIVFPLLPFHILSHSFCLHQDLLKLACSDIHFNSFYALVLVICTLLFDSLLILVSYILILYSVLAIAFHKEILKSLQTCVSHVGAVLVFYIPIIGLSMVHRFGKHLSPVVHVLMGNIYITFPPLMNPIIYGVKTQQICGRIQKWFSMKGK
ncbi:Olfactory Receptor 51V1 [Manis pentadactyla]|nr:Olfactory Receptor 51V1 [Manis pentadactyla]